MSPLRLAAIVVFGLPLVASAQPLDEPLEPPFLPVAQLPEGAVLERIGSGEAKKVVESLAAGDTGLMVTREAKRILARWR